MLIFYNILQLLALIVFAPVLFVKVILTPKYRGRIPRRLGFGLHKQLRALKAGRVRIWIHALSLGEVSSAESLVKGIRKSLPGVVILFSASTRTGERFARAVLAESVDLFVPFPFDVWWSVRRFIHLLAPDLFILVETDFWPNFLYGIRKKSIPSLLVNGRFSQQSFAMYQRLKLFFLPLFDTFQFISMQTERDAERIIEIGVSARKVKSLGNLKYDTVLSAGKSKTKGNNREELGISEQAEVWVAGSTHAGEEEIILRVYKRLKKISPDLFLVIAPRNIERGSEIFDLACRHGFKTYRRQGPVLPDGNVLIVDTLGELAGIYSLCDVAFVGGSLVRQGGHNPLEPAALGKPVFFGPHMDDFFEVAQDLIRTAGGVMVQNEEELFRTLSDLLPDESLKTGMGKHGAAFVRQHQGATVKHVELIRQVLCMGKKL